MERAVYAKAVEKLKRGNPGIVLGTGDKARVKHYTVETKVPAVFYLGIIQADTNPGDHVWVREPRPGDTVKAMAVPKEPEPEPQAQPIPEGAKMLTADEMKEAAGSGNESDVEAES